MQYLGQFIGPMSPNPEKLLIVDGHTPPAETEPYLDYYVKQNYGSSSVSFTSTFPYEKQVFTENIGAYWQTGGGMEAQAAAKAPCIVFIDEIDAISRAVSAHSSACATTTLPIRAPTRRYPTATCAARFSCRTLP